jgi:hypothetical protein
VCNTPTNKCSNFATWCEQCRPWNNIGIDFTCYETLSFCFEPNTTHQIDIMCHETIDDQDLSISNTLEGWLQYLSEDMSDAMSESGSEVTLTLKM